MDFVVRPGITRLWTYGEVLHSPADHKQKTDVNQLKLLEGLAWLSDPSQALQHVKCSE